MNNKGIRFDWPDYFGIAIGVVFFVIGIDSFILPSKLALGGISGLAVLVHYLLHLPVGILLVVLNIPLLILGWSQVDKDFLVRTVFAVIFSSTIIDLLRGIHLVPRGEILLGAIYGGLVYGFGLGLIYRFGGSLAGTDVVAKVVKNKYGIGMGMMNLILNGLIIMASGVVVGMKVAMYTLIAIYVSSRIIDYIQEGLPTKVVYVISDRSEEIVKWVVHELKRGVTIIQGEGAYTHNKKNILLCAVHWGDIYKLKKGIHSIDAGAFLIIGNAREILGRGFNQLEDR